LGSKDETLSLKSHYLLGQIYQSDKQYTEALAEYQAILEKNPNSADAYYCIGVIYEAQGDAIKARAEWRKALRVQANHEGAIAKLANTH
jgi:tetratricopeptide (TPR) repeat protein